jgi:hypothetical protein
LPATPYRQPFNHAIISAGEKQMENKIEKVFKRTKKVLAKIAKRQGMPMHYNSIMMCINYMHQLSGEEVDYKANGLDDDKIFDYFVKYVSETLFYYPAEDRISKKTFAAFIACLDSSLVDTREWLPDFAEDLFLKYYDPREDYFNNRPEGIFFVSPPKKPKGKKSPK